MEQHAYNAEYYDANGQAGDRPALRYYTRLVRRYIGKAPILDVGCGTGHLMARLSRLGPCDGMELSEYSAAVARRTSPGSEVFTSPSELPAGRYAAVTAIHVVEHIPDDDLLLLLKDIRRACRAGAKFLVVTPDLTGRARRLHGDAWNAFTDPTHINMKSHAEWREFFLSHGWSIHEESSDGLWNFPYSRLPKLLDAARYGLPMAAQFLSGRMLLRPGSGESSLFVLGLDEAD